jgi:regulator of sigma E protease
MTSLRRTIWRAPPHAASNPAFLDFSAAQDHLFGRLTLGSLFMGFFGFTWYFIVVFLIVLSILIYVHEWGHYWVAKRNGVRVEVFSIGFGPEIFGWTNEAGTRWKISAIPLGGYVKMFGENMEDDETGEPVEMSEADKAVSFHHKRIGQRAAIVFAGPAVNFLFAIAAFAVLAMVQGSATPLAVVGEVLPQSAAADAGFAKNDRIVSIDNKKVETFDDLRRIVMANPGQRLTFQVVRGDKEMPIAATPKSSDAEATEGSRKVGLLGIRPSLEHLRYERHNPLMALWIGVEQTYSFSLNILGYVGDMITGSRDAKDLGGPLRIAQLTGEMAQKGIEYVVFLMAVLSVNLGLINLFPVPMLDGGHLAFYAAEAIRGKPLSAKVQEYGFRLGLVLVLVLMVFVTWNDLANWRVFETIKRLFT